MDKPIPEVIAELRAKRKLWMNGGTTYGIYTDALYNAAPRLADEIERLREALEYAPHAEDCESLTGFIHCDPCPFWTESYCLVDDYCVHSIAMGDYCSECSANNGTPAGQLIFSEDSERCHPKPCNCFKRALAPTVQKEQRDPCWSCECACHQAGQNRRCDRCTDRVEAVQKEPTDGR